MTTLSPQAQSICDAHYDFTDKKKPGCGQCPIRSECSGEIARTFRRDTYEGFERWSVAVNEAAKEVSNHDV